VRAMNTKKGSRPPDGDKAQLFRRLIIVVVGLWMFAAMGTGFIYLNFVNVRDDLVRDEVSAFRQAFVVAQDMSRLDAALDAVALSAEITEQVLEDVVDALDYLYVRNNNALKRSGSAQADVGTLEALHQAIRDLIFQADDALAAPKEELAEQFEMLATPVAAVNRRLLFYVDEQYRVQSAAVGEQGVLLQKMAGAAITLVLVMSVIATAAVLLYRRTLMMQARRLKAEQKANFLAYFDPMTGLPNRTRFRLVAEQVFARNEDPMVLLLDLDGFKGINDNYGHDAGDAALIHAAARIKGVVTANGGTAARLGGDEFAAILPGPVSSMRAAAICEQILSDCAEPFDADGARLSVGLSIGIAFRRSVTENKEDEISATQKAADTALYRAKEEGKRTYAFYDADLAELVQRRRSIETGISEALANDGFSLAFQPQIDLATGQVKGFEALCRWTRDGEPISPGEFISVAEATGQVVDIDIWGLKKALATVASWVNDGLMPVSMSANLSPMHFRNDNIVEEVRAALESTGLPPSLVTLEITESILIDDVSLVTSILERLRALGVRLALDDFGTGYSSLAYLRQLDVDYIKIDQSFMRDLERSSETGVILMSLVSLVQGLGKKLVVEGVETEEQAQIVKELGCDVAQGYLYGKPLPERDARARLPNVEDALRRQA